MYCLSQHKGQIWLKFLLLLGISGALTSQASAGCRLVIKGFNYQALECDSYVPLVNEASTLIDLAKRTINNPQCFDKLAAVASLSAGCAGEIYLLSIALSESYAALEAAAKAGTLYEFGGTVYIVVKQGKELYEDVSVCKASYNKFAEWSEDANCSGVGKRPELPSKYRNAKPARITYSSGLRYLETLDGSQKLPFDGRFYNAQTNKCDVYSQGRLITSTLFSLCDEFKTGERFHWSAPDRTCNHLSYGNDLGRVQNYRCGIQYETNEITYKTAVGFCRRSIGSFVTPLNDASCSGLTAAADAYIWQNNRCELYRNGRFTSFVDKTSCGRVENFRYEFTVNSASVGECRRVKDNGLSDLVANSYCGQPSRYVVQGATYCTLSVDGKYEKLIFDGSDNCQAGSSNSGSSDSLPEIACLDRASDGDGDGWGFENGVWCNSYLTPVLPTPLPPAPPLVCQSSASDPDGDGWGWENGASCQVISAAPPASNGDIFVVTPTRISAYGNFSVTVTSNLQRPVTAELYLKEDGGNWSSYGESRFIMHPGQNYPEANILTFPDASRRYRIEVRVIEGNYSKEVYSQPVEIQY